MLNNKKKTLVKVLTFDIISYMFATEIKISSHKLFHVKQKGASNE